MRAIKISLTRCKRLFTETKKLTFTLCSFHAPLFSPSFFPPPFLFFDEKENRTEFIFLDCFNIFNCFGQVSRKTDADFSASYEIDTM